MGIGGEAIGGEAIGANDFRSNKLSLHMPSRLHHSMGVKHKALDCYL